MPLSKLTGGWRAIVMTPTWRAIVAAFAFLVVTTGSLRAQVDDEVISGIQFNFVPPGARSLGLGGAFVAIANDATAAFTNPAGLTHLTQQEVSFEARAIESATLFTDGGRGNAVPSGIGLDTESALRYGESKDSFAAPAFLSYVRPASDFRFALYAHRVVDFSSRFESEGAFYTHPDRECRSSRLSGCGRLFPITTDLEVSVRNLGAAFAVRMGRVSLGLGVNHYDFDIEGTTLRYDVVPDLADLSGPGKFFGPPLRQPEQVFATQEQRGEGRDVAFNAGLLIALTRSLSLGFAYRDGASFPYLYTITCGPSAPEFCSQVPGLGSGRGAFDAVFHLPAEWGAGLAFQPLGNVTVALDYTHIEYSALVEDFTVAANPFSDPEDFGVDDADEVHLGIEIVLTSLRRPIALRFGGWYDPAHQIRFVGSTRQPDDDILWSASDRVEDEVHVSAGGGFTIGENISLDLAVDVSDRVSLGSASLVYRF
jgi:long-subunit fatty acid transport protein